MIAPLEWVETEPGRVCRSLDGRYAIVAHTLPENPPRTVFQARRIDMAMANAYPTRGDLGVLIQETPWAWNSENSVHSAEAIANRDAYARAYDRDVPEDHPAVALDRFFWPISEGTTRAALAVTWRDGDLVAELIGMCRRADNNGFEPSTWAEINLTRLGLTAPEGLHTTTEREPQCPNCGVHSGEPHHSGCETARCLVTGQQRLMCTYFGGSPAAGIEALSHPGSHHEDEFTRFFATPTEHHCGQEIWKADSAGGA